MPKPVRYHVGQQHAAALLHPLQASVGVLEDRAQHYMEHLPMSPDDQETVRRVWEVLAGANQEIERLRLRSMESTRS